MKFLVLEASNRHPSIFFILSWIVFLVSSGLVYLRIGSYSVAVFVYFLFSLFSMFFFAGKLAFAPINRRLTYVIVAYLLVISFEILLWSRNPGFSLYEMSKTLLIVLCTLLIATGSTVICTADYSESKQVAEAIYFVFLGLNILVVAYQFASFVFVGKTPYLPWQEGYGRATGLLGEPAHLSGIFFGLLMISDYNERWKRIFLTMSIVSLMLTFSSTNWLLSLLLLLKLVLLSAGNFFGIFVLFVVVSVSLLFFATGEIPILSRIPLIGRVIASASFSDGSTIARLTKGYFIYGDLNPNEKLFGVGLGNLNIAVDNYSGKYFFSLFTSYTGEFVGGLWYDLICTGLSGALLSNLIVLLVFLEFKNGFVLFVIFELFRYGTHISLNSYEMGMIFTFLAILLRKRRKR